MATFTLIAQVQPTIVGQGFVDGLIGVEVTTDNKIWVTEYGTGNDDGTFSIIAPMAGQARHCRCEAKYWYGQQSFTWETKAAQPGMYLYHPLVDGRVASGLLEVAY